TVNDQDPPDSHRIISYKDTFIGREFGDYQQTLMNGLEDMDEEDDDNLSQQLDQLIDEEGVTSPSLSKNEKRLMLPELPIEYYDVEILAKIGLLKDPLKKWLVLDKRKQLLQHEGLECFCFFYGKIGHHCESFPTPVAPTRPVDGKLLVPKRKAVRRGSVPKTKGIVDASNGSVSSPKAGTPTPRITQNKRPTSSVSVAPSSKAGNIAHSIITFKKYQTFADMPTVPFIATAVSSGAAADAALPSRPAISKINMAVDLQSNTHDKLVNSVPTFGLAVMNKPSEAAASCKL
ncbi:hypothetical protein Gorai_013358, partial [Gossypium raimondii]|nr:hypothetical protein [Gossypium raimondii]